MTGRHASPNHHPTKHSGVVAGFDAKYWPGYSAMLWLKNNTNFLSVGYYLTPAPSQGHALGWMGKRAWLVSKGWQIDPIYVGRQSDMGSLSSSLAFIEDAPKPAGKQGILDADQASRYMSDEGFPLGSTVYLDIESPGAVVKKDLELQTYIKNWCAGVVDKGFSAGVYCYLGAAGLVSKLAPGVALWVTNSTKQAGFVSNIDKTSTGGLVLPEPKPTEIVPTGSIARGWQYTQPINLSVPTTVVASGHLSVDLDSWVTHAVTAFA